MAEKQVVVDAISREVTDVENYLFLDVELSS